MILEYKNVVNLVVLTVSVLCVLCSVLCVPVSWGWRTKTSSRFIKNRPADFGTIKTSHISKSFFFFFFLFRSYFVFYFVCMLRILFRFKPSGSKATLSGLPCVIWGQQGEQTEVRTRTKQRAGLRDVFMSLTRATASNTSVRPSFTQTDIWLLFGFLSRESTEGNNGIHIKGTVHPKRIKVI